MVVSGDRATDEDYACIAAPKLLQEYSLHVHLDVLLLMQTAFVSANVFLTNFRLPSKRGLYNDFVKLWNSSALKQSTKYI